MIFFHFFLLLWIVLSSSGIREVSATSCQPIEVRLGLGTTTQIVLEQEPKVTLFADTKHFKITTNKLAPRSLAIIPSIEPSELEIFRDDHGKIMTGRKLAEALNKSFKTNLFIFFENNNQLMFELRFVPKQQADYILKIKQIFNEGCVL